MPYLLGSIGAVVMILPLAWKWQLGARRVVTVMPLLVAFGAGAGLALNYAVGIAQPVQAIVSGAVTLLAAVAILAYRFYRDPERNPPAGDNLILSPADGEIVYVRRSEDGRLPVSTKRGESVALEELTRTKVHEGESIVVGIGMSLLDVHVNRAPITGDVVLRRHFPGRFGSLRRPEMVFENERATTVIANHELQVAVVQIASRLVRQIVALVGEGQDVERGQRIGSIRLGSQVDLVIPNRADLCVTVAPGDRVQAGTSVIATLSPQRQMDEVRSHSDVDRYSSVAAGPDHR